jgi:hypothetical protein
MGAKASSLFTIKSRAGTLYKLDAVCSIAFFN